MKNYVEKRELNAKKRRSRRRRVQLFDCVRQGEKYMYIYIKCINSWGNSTEGAFFFKQNF